MGAWLGSGERLGIRVAVPGIALVFNVMDLLAFERLSGVVGGGWVGKG